MKTTAPHLLLSLVWSLVEAQTAPYTIFMGEILPNHSYVDLTLVRGSPGQGVECHTDLTTCCGVNQGQHRGDWFFPDGSKLPFFKNAGNFDISELRAPEPQMVQLFRRNNARSPSGIYRCDIAIIDDTDNEGIETIYVGLYANGGMRLMYISLFHAISPRECALGDHIMQLTLIFFVTLN